MALRRIDMDGAPVRFCDDCGGDALDSGLFGSAEDDDDDDEPEDEPDDEPAPGDYVVSSNGFRLSVGIVEGAHVGDFAEDEDAEDAIREHRASTSPEFFPEVWHVSDHGNVSRYAEDGFPWEAPAPELDREAVEAPAARASALAELLDIAPEDVQEATYGEHTYDADGGAFLVLTDEEADEAAREAIRELVWAFRPEFVAGYVPEGIDADTLRAIQGERCEDANAPILALIEAGAGFDDFAADAIATDGRGHFLSQYDGEEREAGEFYVYRTN